jgi:hypothetical protein
VISKLPNNVRIIGRGDMRYDNAPNVHGKGRYKKFGRKYPKEKVNSENIFYGRRTKTQYMVEKWN